MKEKNMEEKEQYFAVVYHTPEYKNAIALLPRASKEECFKALRELRDDPKTHDRILATTIIKRNMANFKDNMIFGCPKSLDVMQEKPKKEKNNERSAKEK